MTKAKIIPLKNASYKVTGSFKVVNEKGKVLAENKETYLCRCGQSKNKPFCDGRHRKIGFDSEK